MDVKEINRSVIEQFRAGGEITGMHREGILLLTTIGTRSGRPHTTPMMFHRENDRLLVVASNIGAPRHPDWYTNLVNDARVTVEVGNENYPALATTLTGRDREQTWAMLTANYPFFSEHQAKTARTIPVVALTRT
jgi:deazaflavin-dependent oxidoreductase (nitroreductase family)